MKSLKLNNPEMLVLVASMGKVFKVLAICKTDKEANTFCSTHADCGVIAQDATGLIYIAELYGATVPSGQVRDFLAQEQ